MSNTGIVTSLSMSLLEYEILKHKLMNASLFNEQIISINIMVSFDNSYSDHNRRIPIKYAKHKIIPSD